MIFAGRRYPCGWAVHPVIAITRAGKPVLGPLTVFNSAYLGAKSGFHLLQNPDLHLYKHRKAFPFIA
jgi:hypothetical protein